MCPSDKTLASVAAGGRLSGPACFPLRGPRFVCLSVCLFGCLIYLPGFFFVFIFLGSLFLFRRPLLFVCPLWRFLGCQEGSEWVSLEVELRRIGRREKALCLLAT